MVDQLNIQWRNENERTKYPFVNTASLTNSSGMFIPETIFVDLRLYIAGAEAEQRLAVVEYTGSITRLWFGDPTNDRLAYIEYNPVTLEEGDLRLEVRDQYGRPCGLALSDRQRLGFVQAWPIGDHLFTYEETALVPLVIMPMPATGVRSVGVEGLTPLTGEVFLVGRYGVQIIPEPETNSLYIHCPGEPLYQIDLCRDQIVGKPPPVYLKTLTVKWNLGGVDQAVKVYPDEGGNFTITPCGFDELGNALSSVLRIFPSGTGLRLEAVK